MGGALEVWPYCIKKKFKKTICCIKIYGGKCISLFCNIDIVFTIHHTSLNRDMSEVSLLITAFGSQNKVPHSNDMVVVSEA